MTDWAEPADWYDVLNPWGPSDDFYLELVMGADRNHGVRLRVAQSVLDDRREHPLGQIAVDAEGRRRRIWPNFLGPTWTSWDGATRVRPTAAISWSNGRVISSVSHSAPRTASAVASPRPPPVRCV